MADTSKIIYLGDSWGAGVQNASSAAPIYRRAIGGTLAAQWAKDTRKVFSTALKVTASAFFLSLGGNDVIRYAQDGKVTQAELLALAKNYHAVLSKLVSRYGKGVVLTYRDPAFGTNPLTGFVVPQANLVIRLVAGMFPTVKEVSAEWHLGPEHFDLAKDWIHPQASGFKVLHGEVLKLVQKM